MSDPQSTATTAFGIITDRFRREDESRFVLDFVAKSKAKRDPYQDIWEESFQNYMVASPTATLGRTWPSGQLAPWFATKLQSTSTYLKDPETHQIIESLVAQALLLLLGQRQYITAIPVGSDDYEKARLHGRLLQAQMEQPGVFRTHYQLFKNAFIFGTSILEIGWETRSRLQVVKRTLRDPLTQAQQVQSTIEEIIYKDRPTQKEIPLWDFYPDPGGTRIHENMCGVAKGFSITVQDAMQLAEAGVYDKAAVKRAVAYHAKRAKAEMQPINGRQINLPEGLEVLEGYEYWGYSPISTPDGATNRVITLLEGENVRSHINPFLKGEIPFKEIIANPISGRFYGLSPAETIRFLQDSADNMLMVLNEAADLAVRSPLLVGGAFGGNTEQLRLRKLNDLIMCRDPKAVMPLQQDLSVLGLASQELLRRKLNMREASGATNPMQAIESGDRTTATEVSELVRLASQRVESMVSLIERDDYPWIGRTLYCRNQQFLPPGGAAAVLDGEYFEVPLEDFDLEVDVRFTGSRTAQSQFQKTAALKEAIVTLASSMDLIPIMPELIERYLRDGLDIVDAKEIMTNAVLRNAMLQQQAQASQPSSGGSDSSFGTQAGETERDGQRVA